MKTKVLLNKRAMIALDILAQCDPVSKITVAEIAKNCSISVSYTEQIISILLKLGVLISSRGPGGGYRLSPNLKKFSVFTIVSATQTTRKEFLVGASLRLNSILEEELRQISIKEFLDFSKSDN